jgi:hypothetical protein
MPQAYSRTRICVTPLITGSLLLAISSFPAVAQPAKKVSFAKDIAPLLTQRCMECHGREPLMANLDLRTREGALKGAKHGPGNRAGKCGRRSHRQGAWTGQARRRRCLLGGALAMAKSP